MIPPPLAREIIDAAERVASRGWGELVVKFEASVPKMIEERIKKKI